MSRKGNKNSQYIDGRTLEIFHCKTCYKIINYRTALYGTGYCKICFLKQGKTNYIDGRTLKKYQCKECNKQISRDIGLYGSRLCGSCVRLGNKHYNYIDGRSYESYPQEFNSKLKLKIRKRDNFECQNCEMTEEEHITVYGRVLEVHHIDYNKENCDEENLITTCKQCNTRANHNRKYWTEYFKNLTINKEK